MEHGTDKKKISELQMKDVFLEIGNIGSGSCMAALSHMIGREVRYSFPVVMELNYDRIAEWFGPEEENVVGVLNPLSGDISGMFLQVYKKEMVSAILEGVLDRKPDQEELDGRMLDLLREIANITASSYLTALSSYTDCRIDLLDSAVSMDMEGAIVTELIGAASHTFGRALCIGSRFLAGCEQGESCMLAIFREESIKRLIKAMEVEL